LIGEGDVDVIAAEREALDDAQGWFINMERSGEKILGSSTTLENVVRFVSYVPGTQNLGACEPDIGESFFWTVNIADGTPYDSSDDPDESGLVKEDRWKDIPGGGLAPPVKTLFVDTTDGVIPTTVSGINVLEELDTVDVTKRWYWAECVSHQAGTQKLFASNTRVACCLRKFRGQSHTLQRLSSQSQILHWEDHYAVFLL